MDAKLIFDKLRSTPWLLVAVPFLLVVLLMAPFQLPVLAWALAKQALAVTAGYWADRTIFPYARPHEHPDNPWYQLRRAILIAATMLALGLGV
jgi:hypothetical protein